MTKKKNAATFPIHTTIIVGSVLAGLFVAGCSPMMPSNRVNVEQKQAAPSASPAVDLNNADYETDIQEMDANMETANPTELNGDDMQ